MNNQNQDQKPISQEILTKIKDSGIKMRPRFYFMAKTIFLALGIIFVIFFILYLASFVVFSLRVSGAWFLPRFGNPGIKILLISLPWVPILLVSGAIVLLEILAKRFNLVYRRPIVYFFLAIIVLAIIGGFLLERTPLHSRIFIRSQNERWPGIGNFYRQFGAPQPKNARFGIVLSIEENKFLMQAPDNQTTTVVYTEKTRIPEGYIIKEGDKVSVLGKLTNEVLEAFEIRQVKGGDFKFFLPPPRDFPHP